MMEFKFKMHLEDATLFRVEYICYLNDDNDVQYRDFKSMKSLSQWVARNDNDKTFGIVISRTLALMKNGEWEPYTTIGKKTITLTELKTIVVDLEAEGYKSSIVDK